MAGNKGGMPASQNKPSAQQKVVKAGNKPGDGSQYESHPKADDITPETGPVGEIKEGRRKRERALGKIMDSME